MSDEWLKYLHILGVILFIGNIIVTAWWKTLANRTRDPMIICFSQRQVTLTDYVFTIPGILLLVVCGDLLAFSMFESSWDVAWVTEGRFTFALSGVIWLFILLPTQRQQAKLAQQFSETAQIPEHYWVLCRRWNIFGTIAILVPLYVLMIMVSKMV